jgi:Zn-dependent peptidase ImmA (M78 family)/DNA-binding XRE family transcriptional regulator
MVRVARESRELTQFELAELAGVSQGWLSKVENGLMAAPRDTIVKIAAVLRYPITFFYQQERLVGLPARFYRKVKALNGKTLDRIHAEVNIVMLHLDRLRRSIELEDANLIPRLDPDEAGSPEEVARYVREIWHLPRGPVKDLFGSVEAAGGIIVLSDFGPHRIDGVGLLRSALPPMFFLNRRLPTDRLRFTLAHELGHVIMHGIPGDEMEVQANRFASELLMPQEEMRAQLSPVTLERLATLKLIWGVSMAALLKRAETLKVITSAQYRYLWSRMGAAGYRTAEPPELDLPPERAGVITDIFQAYLQDLGYSAEQLRHLLAIGFDDFRRLYPEIGGRLQIVRDTPAGGLDPGRPKAFRIVKQG